MKCPRCEVGLVERRLGKRTCRGCELCGGVFVRVVGAKVDGVRLRDLKPGSGPCLLPVGGPALASPFDASPMKRFEFEGIQLDHCSGSNSIWLDGGELEAVAKKYRKKREAKRKDGLKGSLVDGALDFGGEVFFRGLFALFDW